MVSSIEKEKETIARGKEKIRLREMRLKEKEKQKRMKMLSEVGKLAYKVGIDQFDKEALLGAFYEISEKLEDPEQIKIWKEKAELVEKRTSEKESQLVITFNSTPDKETRSTMKELRFHWNSFRNEFYGYGCKEKISKKLENFECKIEVLDE